MFISPAPHTSQVLQNMWTSHRIEDQAEIPVGWTNVEGVMERVSLQSVLFL